MPTLPTNYVLTVPIEDGYKPKCVYFANGTTGRKLDYIDVGDIF
jgi:hypothetical protein